MGNYVFLEGGFLRLGGEIFSWWNLGLKGELFFVEGGFLELRGNYSFEFFSLRGGGNYFLLRMIFCSIEGGFFFWLGGFFQIEVGTFSFKLRGRMIFLADVFWIEEAMVKIEEAMFHEISLVVLLPLLKIVSSLPGHLHRLGQKILRDETLPCWGATEFLGGLGLTVGPIRFTKKQRPSCILFSETNFCPRKVR